MRHAARQELRLARSVYADETACGPVGQRRACTRSERNGPVEGASIARQAVADVERARRRRRVGGPDADLRPEDDVTRTKQRGRKRGGVDEEAGVDGLVAAQRPARRPARDPGARAGTQSSLVRRVDPAMATMFAVCSGVDAAR